MDLQLSDWLIDELINGYLFLVFEFAKQSLSNTNESIPT